MQEKRLKTVFVFVCNSRFFGIARFLIIADRFDDAFSKIEKIYPEINKNDIIKVERQTYSDVL